MVKKTSKKTIEKTKLIKLISTFSTIEWKRFGRFIHSPYHNTNPQITTLYRILKQAFPYEASKDLEQERIYKKVYGKELFKLSKFQNLCSDLFELATDFMVDVYLEKEKRRKKKLIIDMFSERNYELFKGANQQLIKEVEAQEYLLDSDDFLLMYQLNAQLHQHLENDTFNTHKKELKETWLNLNAFNENTKAQFLAENMGNQNMLQQKGLSENSNNSQLKNLFQKVSDLHQKKQTAFYFQVKEEIFKHWNQLKLKHKTDLMIHLLNFTFTSEFLQQESGHKESLVLYKKGVADKVFIINEKMRDVEFMNIGMIGFRLKEDEWTESFIQTHQQYLSETAKDFIVPLIYAYKANFQKKYDLVIELLAPLNPTNQLRYLPKIKSLLIRAYFDGYMNGRTDYKTSLHYEIDSFKKMMNRNKKLSTIKINAYLNFLNSIKELLNIYTNNNQDLEKMAVFEEQLRTTSPLILKQWLVEKITAIKNATSN